MSKRKANSEEIGGESQWLYMQKSSSHSAVISSAMTLASFFSTKIDEYVAPKGTGWSSAIIAHSRRLL